MTNRMLEPGGWKTLNILAEDWHAYFTALARDMDAEKAELEAQCRPHGPIVMGHEVPLETVVKRNKNGTYSSQSIMGKVVNLIFEIQGQVKAGHSRYYSGDEVKAVLSSVEGRKTKKQIGWQIVRGEERDHYWIDSVARGHYVTVVGSEITLDKHRVVTLDELKEVLGNV